MAEESSGLGVCCTEAVFLIASTGTALALAHLHNELTQVGELTCIGLIELTSMGIPTMFTAITAPSLTLLLLSVIVGLGTAFVWMIWEIEQNAKSHRGSDHFGGAGSS